MPNRPKVVAVVGATASGKTGLSLALAEAINGELISADSRQVYVGLDIGSGKEGELRDNTVPNTSLREAYPKLRYLNATPQWLIDVADPKERFTVADWQSRAYEVIDDILRRGKLPIVVGGTGLYIAALFEGYVFNDSIPRDENNPRHAASVLQETNPPDWDVLTLAIDLPREELYQRIDERVDARIEEGLISEGERLMSEGIDADRLRKFGLEYRFLADLLEHKMPRNEFAQKLKYAIHGYARRQLTWFRKHGEIHWIKNKEEAAESTQQFVNS